MRWIDDPYTMTDDVFSAMSDVKRNRMLKRLVAENDQLEKRLDEVLTENDELREQLAFYAN